MLILFTFSYFNICVGGFPGGSDSKQPTCSVGDLGLTPGLERSPGEGNGYPLNSSCLGNPMDRGAWWATLHGVTKSQAWLTSAHLIFILICISLTPNGIETLFTCLFFVSISVSILNVFPIWENIQTPLLMGILQARILEWVAMSSSSESSQPRDPTQVSRIVGGFFTIWATSEAQEY